MAPWRQVPALCPLLPVLAQACASTGTGTGTGGLSPGLLRRSPCGHVGRQSHRQEQVEEPVSGCLWDGDRGRGERLYGSHEDVCGVCAVEVTGCACVCLWVAEMGSKHQNFGEGQPCLGGALLTGWLLGGLASRLHPWLICYVQKHPHTCSEGMAGATMVSHGVAHQGQLQCGVHTPGNGR